jgi:ATP-dependent protease ClpP protease subunit
MTNREKLLKNPQYLSQRLHETMVSSADYETRTIYIMDEIDSDSASKFVVAFRLMDAIPGTINLVISSGGGSEPAGYAIFDVVRMAKNRVVAEGIGCVQSIASLIFQAADHRILAPETRFMIHNGSVELEHATDADTMVAIGKEIAKNNDRYHQLLAERSKLPIATVKKYCRDEAYFSAEEAVEAGFADEVIDVNTTLKKRRKK